MAIVEVKSDSSPMGIQKRIMRNNVKDTIASAVRNQWFIYWDENLSDKEKLEKMAEEMKRIVF